MTKTIFLGLLALFMMPSLHAEVAPSCEKSKEYKAAYAVAGEIATELNIMFLDSEATEAEGVKSYQKLVKIWNAVDFSSVEVNKAFLDKAQSGKHFLLMAYPVLNSIAERDWYPDLKKDLKSPIKEMSRESRQLVRKAYLYLISNPTKSPTDVEFLYEILQAQEKAEKQNPANRSSADNSVLELADLFMKLKAEQDYEASLKLQEEFAAKWNALDFSKPEVTQAFWDAGHNPRESKPGFFQMFLAAIFPVLHNIFPSEDVILKPAIEEMGLVVREKFESDLFVAMETNAPLFNYALKKLKMRLTLEQIHKAYVFVAQSSPVEKSEAYKKTYELVEKLAPSVPLLNEDDESVSKKAQEDFAKVWNQIDFSTEDSVQAFFDYVSPFNVADYNKAILAAFPILQTLGLNIKNPVAEMNEGVRSYVKTKYTGLVFKATENFENEEAEALIMMLTEFESVAKQHPFVPSCSK